MNLEEAKAFLNTCDRDELRDHAFGDTEVYWFTKTINREEVATGYFSGCSGAISILNNGVSFNFEDGDAQELRNCGTKGTISRNDETGPDEYEEGTIMPGLTKEAVLEEITTHRNDS